MIVCPYMMANLRRRKKEEMCNAFPERNKKGRFMECV